MTRTKKIVAVAAIAVAGTFGVVGVSNASDHHRGHYGHGCYRHGGYSLLGGLLRTVLCIL